MGVYINMEMPKDKAVAVVIHPDGTAYTAEMFAGVCTEYLSDCTAFPVPPHGRLIDADELKALVHANIALFDSAPGRMGAEQKLVRAWLASMADDIEDAPTIIPAEGEGNDK